MEKEKIKNGLIICKGKKSAYIELKMGILITIRNQFKKIFVLDIVIVI